MEKTDEKLASLIERLQEAGFAQAPEIIDGAIRAIYWDGLVQIGYAGFFAILFLGAVGILLWGLLDDNDSRGTNKVVSSIVMGGVFLFVILLVGTKDNPWLRMFDPEAALYQQIVEGLLGS